MSLHSCNSHCHDTTIHWMQRQLEIDLNDAPDPRRAREMFDDIYNKVIYPIVSKMARPV